MAKESKTKTTGTYIAQMARDAETLKAASKKPTRGPKLTVGDVLNRAARRDQEAAKRAVNGPLKKADMVAVHTVTNIGQLAYELTQYSRNCKFNTNRMFGVEIIEITNIRGRKVAEIHRVSAEKTKK